MLKDRGEPVAPLGVWPEICAQTVELWCAERVNCFCDFCGRQVQRHLKAFTLGKRAINVL